MYYYFITGKWEIIKNINSVNSAILGTGSYLPDFVLDNGMFDQTVKTNDEWIVSRTGIKERRVEQEKYNFEMIGEACKYALDDSGILADDIDIIIVSSVTQDYSYPSAACLVQNYIQANNAFSFDIAAACAGFVFALDISDAYIKSGRAKNILVASGDIMTRETDYFDRGNCILFGDGAGAAVVSACGPQEGRGIVSCYINCDCRGQNPYFIHSGLYEPGEIFDKETKRFKGNTVKKSDSYLWQNGSEVLRFVSKAVPKALDESLKRAGKHVSELKYIILHQANKRIIDHVIEKYGLDPVKVPINIDRYGNMSSSTVPVLLDELNSSGRLERGDLIALVGFGSGFAYGSVIIKW